MSTKISALDERLQSDINGEEFFPIIDSTAGAYHTYKIALDQLFQSGQGYEKVTGLALTANSNNQFELTYTKEDNSADIITIDKYAIQDNDVAFSHINPDGYITSTQTIATNLSDSKLATAKSVDEHIDYREALYDTQIKGYIGDDDSGVLADFATLANVATDFTNLLDGVKPELNTFKKIEEQFDTIDYSDKIGTSQVNTSHFIINDIDLSKRLSIKDSGITANLISVNAITTDKISNNAVLRSKIADRAISNDKIDDVTITGAKIKDGTLNYTKLSNGAPQWNSTQVDIPTKLNVAQTLSVGSNILSKGHDFKLYNKDRAGTNVHSGRALVHNVGDRLTINYAGDYTGGVNIRGVVTVDDMTETLIKSTGGRAIATKEYVDAADILLNPIAGDKIQDNAIALNHMSDNSVSTLEIVDDSITSAKVENIGPQWNASGDVVVSGKLTANGQTFTLGSNAKPGGNVSLSLQASVSGSAGITRKTGAAGTLLINNIGGSIELSPGSGTSTKLQVSTAKSTFSNPVRITGAGSSTIGYNNFTNPALLVGASDYGIAIDSNEIVQKGNHLHIGVADPATQNINFQGGVNLLATIHGDSGSIQAKGDFITNSGVIRPNTDSTRLNLRSALQNTGGADIELYPSSNTTHPGYAYYGADKHTFRSQDNTTTALTIDSKARKVTLHTEGTATNHLITKGYVDKKKIAPTDLTTGGPQWQSNGILQSLGPIFVSDAAPSNGIYTRNVYGRSKSGSGIVDKSLRLFGGNAIGASIELFDPAHASAANAIRIKSNSTTGIYASSKLSLEVKDNGHVVAPQQTQAFINANNKSLTTKEYVTSEIAKVFPDDNYIRKTGGDVSGDLAFTNQSGKGITWSKNSDFASIKFYNTGDQDTDCRLEFQTGDNNNEYFLFTHKLSGGDKHDLLKISNSEISYKGNKLMTGIATDQVITASIKNSAVTTAKIKNSAVTTAKIGNSAVTTAKIADSQVTEAKLANVAPGFLLGKGHSQTASAPNLVSIGTSITNTHNIVPSSAAVKSYTDSKVSELATRAYTDSKVSELATRAYVDSKVAGVSTGKLYHVNAVQKSRSYFLTHAYNSSSNVKPNATVKNYAMSIFPNLSAGDTVSVVWGYRTHDISNGTTYAFHYATTLYSVVNSSTWNVINNGRII
jgi:hypothetical protein